ncbi:MAG: glycosidase [Planctomycetota bacterium]|nr:glycosidase [Planctomycetota bacterium]
MKKIRLRRCPKNPILRPRPNVPWDSKYVYNPGATIHDGRVYLLYRAEGDEARKNVRMKWPVTRLGLAISSNGYDIDERPERFQLEGEGPDELWGIEDPRISKIGDTYYIVYVQVAPNHTCLALATTKDWKTYQRHGKLMPEVQQRTSGLLPEKYKGEYVLIHRIRPNMQIAFSEDLKTWHDSQPLMGVRPGMWDCNYMGLGAQPLKTEKGWLLFYHGVDHKKVYRLGAAWLDLDDPRKVIGRLDDFILEPEDEWEVKGLVANVVYTCGAVELNGEFIVYYGASDSLLCAASIGVDEMLSVM